MSNIGGGPGRGGDGTRSSRRNRSGASRASSSDARHYCIIYTQANNLFLDIRFRERYLDIQRNIRTYRKGEVMKKSFHGGVASTALSIFILCIFFIPSGAQALTQSMSRVVADEMYRELSTRMDSGWISKEKAPVKCQNRSCTTDRNQTEGIISIVHSSDGSWTITLSFNGNFRLIGSQLGKSKSISIAYNAHTCQVSLSGALYAGAEWDVPLYPMVILKTGVGVGVVVGTYSNGLYAQPYLQGTGGAGFGIPFVGISGSFNGTGYLRFEMRNNVCPENYRYIGWNIVFNASFQVGIVLWSQDWRLAGSEYRWM